MTHKKEKVLNFKAYSVTGKTSPEQAKLNKKHTQELRYLMNKTPSSRKMLEWADDNNIRIYSAPKCDALLSVSYEQKSICLDSLIRPSILADLLTHELNCYRSYHPPSEKMSHEMSQTSYFWKKNAAIIVNKQSHSQKKDDKKRIQKIRSLMNKSPLGKQMLKWADERNVQIYLDHQCEKAIGYYGLGANAVCLNSRFKDTRLIETLAHELRHCWQDHNGLIAGNRTSPQEYAVRTRFIEADAFAFGRCVAYEVSAKTGIASIGDDFYNRWAKQSLKENPNALKKGVILNDFFELFFTLSSPRSIYDNHSLKTIADHLEIIDYKTPNVTGEFTSIGLAQRNPRKLNPYDESNVRKLGDIFGQYNYLDHTSKDLSKDEKYIGNFAKEHKTLFKQIKHHNKMQKKGFK